MSHTSGDTDNHKTKNIFIPSDKWGEDIYVDAKLVENNIIDIENEIAPCKPRIIGVTKYFGLNAIVSGYKAGLRDFGESRAVEAIRKINLLPDEVRVNSKFHFIGHLQTNKADKVVEYFDCIHSIDSMKIAIAVSNAACRLNKREKVLIQVNNAGEEQKFGYKKEELYSDFGKILSLDGLEVVGLMNMATLGANENLLKTTFADLRDIRDNLEREFNVKLPELSMGMSDDFHIAVKEGATMIRVGRKLFK